MPTDKPTDKVTSVTRIATLATALATLPDADNLLLGGQPRSRADLLAQLSAYVTATATTASALQGYKKALDAERAAKASAEATRKLLKVYLQSRFGNRSPALATFGFAPDRVPKTPVVSKAERIAKAAATRAARHTMGSRQKKEVKGDVTGVVLTPTRSTPAPGAPTAPAPAPNGPGATPAGAGTTPRTA